MFKRFLKSLSAAIFNWADQNNRRDYPQEAQMVPSSLGGISNYGSNLTKASPARALNINETINGMNFIVYPATGGKVVQFSHYDERTGRNNSHLYVITDSEDLGEEMGQIITKECLSR